MANIVKFTEEIRDRRRAEAEKRRLKKKQTAKKHHSVVFRFVRAVLAAAFTVVLVLAAIYVIRNRDSLNIDSFRRFWSYQSLEKDEQNQAEEIYYDVDSTNCFAQADENLVLCSDSVLKVFAQDGTTYIDEKISMTDPAVRGSGSYAVAYDLGGTELYGILGRKLIYNETVSGKILNARINSSGFLTLLTQDTGYKGIATVYDSEYTAKAAVSISSAYVMDASASEDGSELVVITIGESDETFASSILFYSCTTGDLINTYTLTDTLVIDVDWDENGVWLQTDTGCVYATPEGGIQGTWNSSGGYLRGYAHNDSGYQAMIWNDYETGYQGKLLLIDENGSQVASMETRQEIFSISAAGDYIALLYTNRLDIYTTDLELYATLEDTAGARQVLMREDGTALLCGSVSTSLFVP